MKNTKKAETIAGILISVVILGVAILGILKVLEYNEKTFYKTDSDLGKIILEKNSINIGNKIDLSSIDIGEKFYVEKTGSEFKIYTGSTNEIYKFVNTNGTHSATGKYERTYEKLEDYSNIIGDDIDIKKNNFKLEIKKSIYK